jgi:hypothetical protein
MTSRFHLDSASSQEQRPNHALPFRQAQGPEWFDRAHHPERVEGLAGGQRIPIENPNLESGPRIGVRHRDCNRRASWV